LNLAAAENDLPWLALRQAMAAGTPRPRTIRRRWYRQNWAPWQALTFGCLWSSPSSRGEWALFDSSTAERIAAIGKSSFPAISPEGLFSYAQRPVVVYSLYRKTIDDRTRRYHLAWCAALYRECFIAGNMMAASRAQSGRFPIVCARRRGFAHWERRTARAVSRAFEPCPDCLEYLATVRPGLPGPSFTLGGYHDSFRTGPKSSFRHAPPGLKMNVWPTALGSRWDRCVHCGALPPPEQLQLTPRDHDRLNQAPENVIALCADCLLKNWWRARRKELAGKTGNRCMRCSRHYQSLEGRLFAIPEDGVWIIGADDRSVLVCARHVPSRMVAKTQRIYSG
jgi:hypothetical protein